MSDSIYNRRMQRTMDIVSGCPTNRAVSRKKTIGDRLIPTRAGNSWQTTFRRKNDTNYFCKGENRDLLHCIIENEVLNSGITDLGELHTKQRRVFSYHSHSKPENLMSEHHSLSPLTLASQKILQSPFKKTRKITAQKIMSAPNLVNDFYLNLVDWSSQNFLGIGIGTNLILWDVVNKGMSKLYDTGKEEGEITSVAWSERGNLLSVGTEQGTVQVWDIEAGKCVQYLHSHSGRVTTLAWNNNLLASSGNDSHIHLRDTRMASVIQLRIAGHNTEVCGLKWSPDEQLLASGDIDGKLFVWGLHSPKPEHCLTGHSAAIKAIAWSPHRHGVLVTGGGSKDTSIRFWNTLTSQQTHHIYTGSQVCGLMWYKHSPELVSTHGYPNNSITVWAYPSLAQVANQRQLSSRKLYSALSPNSETIVIGTSDSMIELWNVFEKPAKTGLQKETRSVLNPFTCIR